jgi:hypothetical protein
MDNWRDIGCELLEKCIIEFKKKENMDKINTNVLDPLIDYILKRLYPYILITCVMFLLMLIFLILVAFMLFRSIGFSKI